MNRWSGKYPVSSWSYDTRCTSRGGSWENNLTSDYEALYEFLTDQLPDTPANAEKRKRLRDRGFIDDSGKVCVMVARNEVKDEIERISSVGEDILRRFAGAALEYVMTEARNYPPQMQDLIVWKYALQGDTENVIVWDKVLLADFTSLGYRIYPATLDGPEDVYRDGLVVREL